MHLDAGLKLEGFVSSNVNRIVEMLNRNGASEKEEFWRLAVDEWRESGLKIRAFCKREQLSEPAFYSWRSNRTREPGCGVGLTI